MSTIARNGQEASSLLPLHALDRDHSDDEGDSDSDLFAEEAYANGVNAFDSSGRSISRTPWSRLIQKLPIPRFLAHKSPKHVVVSSVDAHWKRRVIVWIVGLALFWLLFAGIFLPSYSRPPQHYTDLRKRALASKDLGRGNINNEKVYIAASIFDKDGSLLSGDWSENVLDLVELLGPDNVFVSVYENDASEEAAQALYAFQKKLTCKHVVLNEHLNVTDLQHVIMPDGERLLKRIAFLSKVRNRALAPLDDPNAPIADWKFDKLLYVNDVVFDPIDVANLLFSTHQSQDGKTDYRAACATDFINPFKFYDTFATRDLAGNDMGVPFFPWFANSGQGTRRDVLEQKDAVRVRSCWGGMVAFRADYFLRDFTDGTGRNMTPVRFRAEEDSFWDASECCLIHADIQHLKPDMPDDDKGIYMNPYVRVAYDTRTLSWLGFTRRFERIYAPFQHIVNILAKRPSFNPRQYEEPGQKVNDRIWVSNEETGTGAYQDVERVAKPGGFCGGRKLLALPEDGHGGHWYSQPPPPDVG